MDPPSKTPNVGLGSDGKAPSASSHLSHRPRSGGDRSECVWSRSNIIPREARPPSCSTYYISFMKVCKSRKYTRDGEVSSRGRRRGVGDYFSGVYGPHPRRRGRGSGVEKVLRRRQRGPRTTGRVLRKFRKGTVRATSPEASRGLFWHFLKFHTKSGPAGGVILEHAPPNAEMCAHPVRRIYKRGKQKR